MSAKPYRIAVNIKRKQVGCVLAQACMGGTVPRRLFNDLFPVETWDVDHWTECALYGATEDELRQLSAVCAKAAGIE